jgi:DNA-binding response OmpR family regulator
VLPCARVRRFSARHTVVTVNDFVITPLKKAILVVEDDRKTSELITLYLARDGYTAVAAYSGRDAFDLAAQHQPLLAILDVMLPDLDGWEVCRRLRATSEIPILMLSSLGQAQDRIKGLKLGADDFVAKPFSPKELMARVDAILRRARTGALPNRILRHHGLTVDRTKGKVSVDGQVVVLTPSELKLLNAFIAAPGRVYAREELLSCLYPSGGVVIYRVVDVHVGKLRQKIEVDPSNPRYIMTARGMGYYLNDAEHPPANDDVR